MSVINITDSRIARERKAYKVLLDALQFYADGNHLHFIKGSKTPAGFELGTLAIKAINRAELIVKGEAQ